MIFFIFKLLQNNNYLIIDKYFYMTVISIVYFLTFKAIFPFRMPYQPDEHIYHFTNKKSYDLINASKIIYGVSDGRIYFTDHAKNSTSGRHFGRNCTHVIYCLPDASLFEKCPGYRWSYNSLKRRKGEWRTKLAGDLSFREDKSCILKKNGKNYIAKKIFKTEKIEHYKIYKNYVIFKIISRRIFFEPILLATYFTLALIYALSNYSDSGNFISFLLPFSGIFIAGALILIWFPIQYIFDGLMRSKFNKQSSNS